jgi:copper resistance protein D
MYALVVLAAWIHVVAAATWIGGSLFLVIVLVPALRDPTVGERGMDLVHRVARRFLPVGWACFALLLVTGVFALLVRHRGALDLVATGGFWSSAGGTVLAWKLTLVGCILVLSALHDFLLVPLAARAWRANGTSPRVGRLRRAARWAGRLNLVLGVLVVGLGVALVRGWSW